MDHPFSFSVPTSVRFGDGVSAEVVDALPTGTERVVLLRGASGIASGPIVERLRNHGFSVIEEACPKEPSVDSVKDTVARLKGQRVDAFVACGGGAVIDSGKAIAFCFGHDLLLTVDFAEIPSDLLAGPGPVPFIAIPTTAGTGAEVTANAVLEIPSRGAKISLRGRALIPQAALVDPLLLPSAPAATILASGLDAVVQTIEAYTSAAATPFSDALTRPNVELGLRALHDVVATGHPDAWRDLAWVSLGSGVALANSGLGAAHGLASVLGGRYGFSHGALCGRFLIPVLRQNTLRAPDGSEALARLERCARAIADVFDPVAGGDAFSGLEAWQAEQGLTRLVHLDPTPAEIDLLAEQSASASSSKRNAVPLAPPDFADILRATF